MASRVSKRTQAPPLKPQRKSCLPMTRPLRETAKPQVTISTSNILRRKPLKEVHPPKQRKRPKYQESEPDNDLYLDYQDQVETARDTLLRTSSAALNDTHAQLTNTLREMEIRETAFEDKMLAQREQLMAPLTEETVERVYARNGKSITEILNIGERVQVFKSLVKTKEAELEQCWARWDEVQGRILQLRDDVLGAKASHGAARDDPKEKKRGYKREMEILNAQRESWEAEMQEEIRGSGQDALGKMRATEKELNANLRRDKAKLFALILEQEDDD